MRNRPVTPPIGQFIVSSLLSWFCQIAGLSLGFAIIYSAERTNPKTEWLPLSGLLVYPGLVAVIGVLAMAQAVYLLFKGSKWKALGVIMGQAIFFLSLWACSGS